MGANGQEEESGGGCAGETGRQGKGAEGYRDAHEGGAQERKALAAKANKVRWARDQTKE